MIALAEVALHVLALAVAVPMAVLLLECLAARLPARPARDDATATGTPPGAALRSTSVAGAPARPRAAVIVPAHDAAATIDACLAALRPQLAGGDRLIVVADNCRDDTAARARSGGAVVLVRDDPARVGKGWALDHAVRETVRSGWAGGGATAARAPAGGRATASGAPVRAGEVAIVVDADCVAAPDLVARLARRVHATGRPVQAAYLFEPPPDADAMSRVALLATLVRTVVRPRGLARLGLPCLLGGAGMAFPWALLRAAPLAGGGTAEDLRLTVDLACAGHAPVFDEAARVVTRLPAGARSRLRQRRRWEHGHLEVLLAGVPRLARAALRERRPELLALALELGVPPLALLWMAWALLAGAALALGTLGGSWLPAGLLAASGAAGAAAVASAWAGFARAVVPARALVAAPLYAVRKIPLYASFFTRRGAHWTLDEPPSAPASPRHPPRAPLDRSPHAPSDASSGLPYETSPAAWPDGSPDVPSAASPGAPGRSSPGAQADAAAGPDVIEIGGLGFHAVDEARCVARVLARLDAGEGGWLLTANLQHLRGVARDPAYAALCRRASLVVADGMPVVWASRLQGTPLPERIAGSDLVASLTAAAAAGGRSVFLIGSEAGLAARAAAALRARHPGLRVAGTLDAPARLAGDRAAVAAVAERLAAAAPDLVYVGLGTPAQDLVIDRLRRRRPQAWYVGVGMGLGFVAGARPRAPRWMQRAGLEWLHRLAHEPGRLARRYLVEGAPFALRLLAAAALRRRRRPRGARPLRIAYVTEGRGQLEQYRHWKEGRDDPAELSYTYGFQFYDLCRTLGAEACVLSTDPAGHAALGDGAVRIAALPNRHARARGLVYHLGQLGSGLRLVAAVRCFDADLAVVAGGTHWLVWSALPLLGVAVVPSLHATLRPRLRAAPRGQRLALGLARGLFARRCHAILSLPGAVADDAVAAAGGAPRPLVTFLPTYRRETWEGIPPPAPAARPFYVLFSGRIEPDKGILDLLAAARRLAAAGRTDVAFDVCGTGSALAALAAAAAAAGLGERFRCHGHCDGPAMRRLLGRAAVVVVPSRSGCHEGLPKTLLEAVLAGRPVVASRVCPALDEVYEAAVQVPPDDVAAYADAIARLCDEPDLYAAKQHAAVALAGMLLERYCDPANGWGAGLRRIVDALATGAPTPAATPRRDPTAPRGW